MGQFGQDALGIFKRLQDGRVLRVTKQLYNVKLTLSASQDSPVWSDGW